MKIISSLIMTVSAPLTDVADPTAAGLGHASAPGAFVEIETEAIRAC
jgi:hypothetical protein